MRHIAVRLLLSLGLAVALIALVFVGSVPDVVGVVAIFVVALTLYWPLRDRIPDILMVFMTVLLVMIVVGGPAPRVFSDPAGFEKLRRIWLERGPFDERLPVILHLIFDEMMSPGAISETVPTGPSARRALYALGDEYGLRTFDSVYSRAFFSGVAMPNLFNAEFVGSTALSDRFPQSLQRLPKNAYFEELAKRGYRTVVFQTAHLNFCANARVAMCETFASFDPGEPDGERGLSSRALHLASILLRSYEPSYFSRFGQRLLSKFNSGTGQSRDLGVGGRFDVQRFPGWFDRFIGFVEGVPRGTHVFAHFMVPHGPYLLTDECAVGPDAGVGYYLGSRIPDARKRADARQDYYAHYLAQLGCVRSRIAAFLEAVGRNPQLRDATVIVHGDHGSRISVGNLVEDYEQEDFAANYGTYFAVRAPGVEPGVDCEFLSLPEAFRRSIAGDAPLPPLDHSNPPVVVRTKASDEQMVEVPMPRFGCAAQEPMSEGA